MSCYLIGVLLKFRERPNIVFLMLDTLPAGYMSVYGGDAKMKTVEGIGRRGVIYKNAIAPGTYTLTSHVSLFTGKRVRKLKNMTKNQIKNYGRMTDPLLSKNRYIKEEDVTLAKYMSYLGYKTSLFSNNPFLTQSTGLASGFSYTRNIFIEKKLEAHKTALGIIGNDSLRENLTKLAYYMSALIPQKRLDGLYLRLRHTLNRRFCDQYGFYSLDQGAELTNEIADNYFRNTGNDGHFVFMNYMEAHEGYPTNMITDRFVSQDKWMYVSNILDQGDVGILRRAYIKRLLYLDSEIGKLMKILRKRGILDNAVLIISSDHGQAFMEHGQLYHALFPYNELARIPLITAQFKNGRQVADREIVEANVSLSALYNSIIDIGYRKADMVNGSLRRDRYVFSDHTGISDVWDAGLLRLFKNRSKYAEKIYNTKMKYNTFATAIYYRNYKLIHYYRKRMNDELYDLDNDMGEADNIIGKSRAMAHKMLSANASLGS